jgi:hypothetical protein
MESAAHATRVTQRAPQIPGQCPDLARRDQSRRCKTLVANGSMADIGGPKAESLGRDARAVDRPVLPP